MMEQTAPAKKRKIGVVLRAFNNERVFQQIKSLIDTGMINHIVVVVDGKRDFKDVTTPERIAQLLEQMPSGKKPAIQCKVMSDYGWSTALNTGIDTLLATEPALDHVITLSNEVDFRGAAGLRSLIEAAESPNASCGFMQYEGRDELNYQVPRNTCTAWPVHSLERLRDETGFYFNPDMDSRGGMEDVLAAATLCELRGRRPALNKKPKNPIESAFRAIANWYHVWFGTMRTIPIIATMKAQVDIPPAEKHAAKMEKETDAMRYIASHFFYKGIFEKFIKSIRHYQATKNTVSPVRVAPELRRRLHGAALAHG